MCFLAFHRPQSGDTIVEVMIAIALLASVLFSAYAIANDSAQLGMAAREQDQSTQLLQHQAEGLRYLRQQSDDWDSFTADELEEGEFYVWVVGGEWEVENGRGDGHDIIGDSYPDERFTTWSQVETGPGVEDKEEIVIYVRWNTITGQVQTATLDTVLANTDPLPPPDVLSGDQPEEPPEPPEPPEAPEELIVTQGVNARDITLNWEVVDDANTYRIQRRLNIFGTWLSWELLATKNHPTDTYNYTEEETANGAQYRIRAENSVDVSNWTEGDSNARF